MQFTPIFLVALSMVYGAPIPVVQFDSSADSAMMGYQGSITNARQVQDTLNRQLQGNGAHRNQAAINAFITGADSQIDNAIATVSEALAPFTLGASKEVGNFLLGPFVQSVTNGAEVFLSNIVGGSADLADAGLTAALTNNYSKLAAFAKKSDVDASKLQSLSDEISKTVASKSKRADSDNSDISGIKGAITVAKQTIDTMKQQVESGNGHASQAVVNAAITGLDSQIDNLAATISSDLNGVTLGVSGEIGSFLLGPFVQSVTNGAEVIVSNIIGGSMDIVTDGTSALFSSALSNLHELATKFNVKSDDLQQLAHVQKQVAHLKAPKKDGGEQKAKRASDSDLSGANGSLTNTRQVQDTLNRQLQSHNGHAAQATINAFITGTDSQIDNAIATVSDALAPFTGGMSKAIGDALLGPFVQSVTNGAEVMLSNLVGGGIDMVSDATIDTYSKALENLSKAALKYGVKSEITEELQKSQVHFAQLNKKN